MGLAFLILLNTIDIELYSFLFFSSVISSIIIFTVYKLYNSIELCITIAVIIIAIYSFTIFLGSEYPRLYFPQVLFLTFFIYIAISVNLGDVYKNLSQRINLNSILIFFTLAFFLISVFVFNLKDVKSVYGFSKVMILILAPIFYCYYLPKEYYKNEKLLFLIIKLFLVVSIITAVVALVFFYLGINTSEIHKNSAVSYFRHPNSVAFMYSFSFPILLFLILFCKDRFSFVIRVVIHVCMLIVAVAMLFTFSRAGYLSILVSSLFLLFFYNKKLFLYVILAFLLVFSFFFETFVLAKGTGSTISRIGLVFAAIQMIKSSTTGFLWGFGTTSVFDVYTEFKYQLGPLLEDIGYPHNFILFFIMQFGIMPLISIAVYFLITIYKSLRKVFDNVSNQYLLLPLAIVFGLVAQSLLEDTILFPEFFVFHLFLITFGFIVYDLKNNFQKVFK